MGASPPKSTELYERLEEEVKDAILTETDDLVLMKLIELTSASITERRPLFATLMEEPHFYRVYFRRWVEDGLEEAARLQVSEEKTMKQILGDGVTPPIPSPR